MKKTVHRVTPTIQSRIALVAKELPPQAMQRNGQLVYRKVKVLGSRLSQSDLKPGMVLNPEAWYLIDELVYEDHTKNMIEGVKKEGEAFIDDYRTAIFTQLEHFAAKTKMAKGNIFKQMGRKLKNLIKNENKQR